MNYHFILIWGISEQILKFEISLKTGFFWGGGGGISHSIWEQNTCRYAHWFHTWATLTNKRWPMYETSACGTENTFVKLRSLIIKCIL